MNTSFKPLIWSGTAVLIILAIFLLASTDKVTNTAATTNTVSFSGQGKVTAIPDIAMISAGILTQAADSKAAQDSNSQKSQAVAKYLKAQGIDDKDIKTSGYNIYPIYNYNSGRQTITGYQVSENYEIKVRDLSKVSNILSGLVAAGANQVNNLGLQVENPDKLKSEARQKAIEDAKKKAEELKNQVGIKLGRIIGFDEYGTSGDVPYYADKMGMGGGGPTPNIEPGQNDIVINVTLTYQIK